MWIKKNYFTLKAWKVLTFGWLESLMAEWLEQASRWHEMYCHDLEVMSLNLGQVELGTSVLSRTWAKIITEI